MHWANVKVRAVMPVYPLASLFGRSIIEFETDRTTP